MEDKDVHALQYTPRPSTSLEVPRTVSLHALLSLSSPFHSFSVSCCSPSYNLPLEMSEPVGATNQPGDLDTNMPAGTGDGRDDGRSAGGGVPPPEAVQGDNSAQVRVLVFTYRV